MKGPDYIIDIKGLRGQSAASGRNGRPERPWLAIHWRCCGCYSRIYRNRKATAYVGHCPKCARPVRVKIGDGGTSNRFFEAS